MLPKDKSALISDFRPERLICLNAEQAITHADFITVVRSLAEVLPDQQFIINLCQDRYHFLQLFCAVILRGGVNILPPNRNHTTIKQIIEDYPGVICIGDEPEGVRQAATDQSAEITIETLLEKANMRISSPMMEIPQVSMEQVVAIAYTSGSTGKPKPNKKTWRILSGTAKLLCQRFFDDVSDNVLIPTVPAQHMYGLETSIMMVLQGKVTLYAGDTFYPEDISNAFAAVKAGVLVTTPVHLLTLSKSLVDIRGIRKVICATAPLKKSLCAEIESNYDTVVEEIYGFTEAGSVATRRTMQEDSWNLLEGMLLEPGKSGIVVTGPQLISSVPVLDIIEIENQGKRFRLCGRSEDMINVAGKRASLADLNYKLTGIAGVIDAVLFMPEDEGDIARPLALVVSGLEKREILARFSRLVDPVFLPRPLILVDKIPRNETGKPQRLELLKMVEAHERKCS